jgi:hypothetical protein
MLRSSRSSWLYLYAGAARPVNTLYTGLHHFPASQPSAIVQCPVGSNPVLCRNSQMRRALEQQQTHGVRPRHQYGRGQRMKAVKVEEGYWANLYLCFSPQVWILRVDVTIPDSDMRFAVSCATSRVHSSRCSCWLLFRTVKIHGNCPEPGAKWGSC